MNDLVLVIATPSVHDGGRVWRLTVECPFCGHPHWHGGGLIEPGMAPLYGSRFSDCTEHVAFREDCEPVRVKGRPTRCNLRHGWLYVLVPGNATATES